MSVIKKVSAGRWQLRMRTGVFKATPQGITLRSSPERYTHKPGQSREERNPDNYVVLIFSSCMLMPLGSETSRWPRLSATRWCCRPTAASSSPPASCISTASTASRAPPAKRLRRSASIRRRRRTPTEVRTMLGAGSQDLTPTARGRRTKRNSES